MNDNYTYPAIVYENEKGCMEIVFPDFENAITCTDGKVSFVDMAQELLTLLIDDFEENNRKLPEPGMAEYTLEAGQKLVYINVWMPYHRTKIKEVYVKKTLTIPVWLDMLAKANNINFSATLVKGLKEKLGLEHNE